MNRVRSNLVSARQAMASSRRSFLKGLGAAAGLAVAPAILTSARAASSLFTLGVASGDPGPGSVVLWTRLAPDPVNGGGMPARAIPVTWEVALDPGMSQVVRRGRAWAMPRNGHAVSVRVAGLPADRWLWYRFEALGEASRLGRTRTFPARHDMVDRMRFAVANCQNYVQGEYPAYRDMVRLAGTPDDLDFVVHVGDYIYEGGAVATPLIPGRNHVGAECWTVDDYRNRYALYRLDPDLQDAHALYPFIVTWDDHEVENNYAGLIPEESSSDNLDDFLVRRINAYRAYTETMPLEPRARQRGVAPGMRLARSFSFGRLAELYLLDTRQFRSDQAAGDNFGSTDTGLGPVDEALLEAALDEELFDADGILDPEATLLGRAQERWLAASLRRSRATWNVLAQQVMVMPWNLRRAAQALLAADPRTPQPVLEAAAKLQSLYNVDAWDGYPASRERLYRILERARSGNHVVLTGDIHSAWAGHLEDGDALRAVEFVTTSIASTFLDVDPRPTHSVVKASLADNPHIAYFNALFRGYCLHEVTPERWQATYRAVGSPELARATPENPLTLVPRYPRPGDPGNDEVGTDITFEIPAGFADTGMRLTESGRRDLTPF